MQQVEKTDSKEPSLRPLFLDEFIGHKSIKEKLSIYIAASKERKESLDHILFSGPPGLGKTSMASIVAKELGAHLHVCSAPAISKSKDLAKILTLLNERDVLFIDEIHRLPRVCEEILYPAMEDYCLDLIIGEGLVAESIRLSLKPFTLIAATTRLGLLSKPLKTRFGIDLNFDFYDNEELSHIILRSAQILEMSITTEASLELAKRSRMTPRIANHLLKRIRDFATVKQVDKIDHAFTKECLNQLQIDELGLGALERKILILLTKRYKNQAVGIKTLSALLDEDSQTIEEEHEPFLLRMGLIEKTQRGRLATQMAYEHLAKQETTSA